MLSKLFEDTFVAMHKIFACYHSKRKTKTFQTCNYVIMYKHDRCFQERIHLNHNKRNQLSKGIEDLEERSIGDIISRQGYETVKRVHERSCEHNLTKVKNRQMNKFTSLQEQNHNRTLDLNDDSEELVDKTRWILNLSSKLLDEDQTSLIFKGIWHGATGGGGA